MALLNRSIAIGALMLLALPFGSCRIVDPLLASGEYDVQAPGKTKIKVRLEGGRDLTRLRQQDVIKDYMLDMSKDPERRSAAFDAMLELEQLFEQNGYPLVHVSHRVEGSGPTTKVIFTIEQGPLVTLRECKIVGNTAVDEEQLRKFLPERNTELLGLGSSLYVAADLDTFAKAIVTHYRGLGYLDARTELQGPDPELTPETKSVSFTVQVQEGAQYSVTAVEIAPEIAGQLKSDAPKPPTPGSKFVPREIREFAQSLAQHLRQHGFPSPEILTTTTPDPATKGVSIRVHGEPGEAVRVKSVEIRGNSWVPITDIRERIEIKTGALFDGRQEDRSLARLYRSGRFRSIDTVYEPAGAGEINLILNLTEASRYLIQPMVGVGSYEGIRAGLEFEMMGIFGSDYDLNSRATVSTKGHRFVTTIADTEFLPSLFGTGTTFSIAGDDFRRKAPSYTDGARGVTPSLSFKFNPKWSARVGYTFRDHSNALSTVIDPGAQLGAYTEGSTTAELSYDSRDNPIMPRSGSRVSLQHSWFDPALGGDKRFSFQRSRFSLSTILPVAKRTRFVVRGEASVLFPEGSFDTVPIQERLFNGGEATVRSYEEDQLAPPSLKDINGQPIGGAYRNVLNAELRWAPPLQPIDAIELELAFFGDAGNLGRNAKEYELENLDYAIGTGLRFLLPIGPVRFDYAYNPDQEPGERKWTFHFSIGYAF